MKNPTQHTAQVMQMQKYHMEIRSFCKKLRYSFFTSLSSKFVFLRSLFPSISVFTLCSSKSPPMVCLNFNLFYSLGYLDSLVCTTKYPCANSSSSGQINDGGLCLKIDWCGGPYTRRHFSSYFASFDRSTPLATPKQVSEIIDLLRGDVNDLGPKLNSMNVTFSVSSSVEIFRILSRERVSALRFFDWLKAAHPDFCYDPDICSLVIDNCGRLGDYEAMVPVLIEFKLKRICLRQRAFGFLLDLSLDKASIMQSTKKVLSVLNEVGGSCQTSGVWTLIEMFTVFGSFDMAEFVIQTTGRKVNHYNILMREFCRRKDCERAQTLLEEMKKNGCDPNITSYNMVISCLCNNEKFAEACQMLEAIEKDYGSPDASTFDIFVHFFCKRGQFDLASNFLDKMIMKGIEPCDSTNAAIIKAYFRSQKYEEAHKFVVDSVSRQKYSSNANYSLLATLHLKKGNVLLALKILHEMMDKGLKPNFRVYMDTSKRLQKLNRKELQSDLMTRYSSFLKSKQ